jgi:phosphoribosylformylglycinamidine (FGAM) synthase-like enzyme
MGQFVGCIRGIGEACRALDFPVVSGNVSLYNETNGRAILPTPTIGGVGLLDDFQKSASPRASRRGRAILLIGETQGWLGQSLYLRDVCGREEGAPPPVDLAAESATAISSAADPSGRVTAVHDLSDGGLAGRARRDGDGRGHRRHRSSPARGAPAHAFWFGEDQARYVVTVPGGAADEIDRGGRRRRPALRLGVTGGEQLTLPGETQYLVKNLKEGTNPGCRPTWRASAA